MKKNIGLIGLLFILVGFSFSFGIDGQNVELVGRTGGQDYAVVVHGNYAYVAEGGGLSILNISNPSSPQLIGMLALPDSAYDVAVSGNYAYVANGSCGLRIINISNLASPYEVGYYDTPGSAEGVAVSGSYAYVADLSSGLRIINISNLASPYEVGYYDTPGDAVAVTVNGNYAYVADGSPGLRIINISNPASPYAVGSCATPGYAHGVAVSGNYAYVADDTSGLRIINVSNPANPVEVEYYDTPGQRTYGIALSGSYAYVAVWGYGLKIININDPSNPVEVGNLAAILSARGVAVSGIYVYVTSVFHGLWIIDVSNPSSPLWVEIYNPVSEYHTWSVALCGNYAYVGNGGIGLRVIDISNPRSPFPVEYHLAAWTAMKIAINGNYTYVAAKSSGLRIFNISNPASPVEVGYYDTPGSAEGIAVSGSYAYVADGSSGLRIINISNPSSPYEVGYYDTPGYACGVAVSGNYAYVTDGNYGLRIINISNPASPAEVGYYVTPDYARGVAVSGSYAYVADDASGLRIINISNPASPYEVGYYDTPGDAVAVTVSGNYAYVADGSSGLRIINISNTASTYEVGHYDTPGKVHDVAVSGNYIYMGQGEIDGEKYYTGLWILRFTGEKSIKDIPDVKLLKNKQQADVFKLNNYLVGTPSANWTWSSKTTYANLSIDGNSWVDYLTPKSSNAGQDTVIFAASGIGSDSSVLKYLSYLWKRLPNALIDNGQTVLSCEIPLQNYIMKDTSIGYPSSYPYEVRYSNSSDSGKLIITFSGNTIKINPSSALLGSAEVVVTATPGAAEDWDKEFIHVSEVVDTYGDFSSASDTSHYWYQLPVVGASSLPTISWVSSAGGRSGVLQLTFTTATQGVKIVYNQELDIEPGAWYGMRCAFASGAGASNQHLVSGQLFVVDTVGGTSEVGSFLRQSGQLRDTTWWVQHAYVHNTGSTIKRMRPILVVKNNGSSGNVHVDSLLLYQSEPLVEQAYGALEQVAIPNGTFDSGLGGWFYSYPAMGIDPGAPLPGYSVVSSFSEQNNVLQLSFTQVKQGLKLTSDPVVNITPMKSTKLSWKVYGAVSNSNRSVSGRVYCIDTAIGGVLSDVLGPSGVNVYMPSGQWVSYTAVGSPVLTTETQARVQIVVKNGNTANDTVYLDDITLEQENDSPYYWDHSLF